MCAFTVRFVTFSVVMGDGTDLNVTAAIGNRGATLVSQASPGLPVHWHDHNVHAYLVEGTTDFLDAETGIRYNVGPWMHDVAIPEVLRTRMYARICRGRLVPRSAKWGAAVPMYGCRRNPTNHCSLRWMATAGKIVLVRAFLLQDLYDSPVAAIQQEGWNRETLCYPTDACFDADPAPKISGYR